MKKSNTGVLIVTEMGFPAEQVIHLRLQIFHSRSSGLTTVCRFKSPHICFSGAVTGNVFYIVLYKLLQFFSIRCEKNILLHLFMGRNLPECLRGKSCGGNCLLATQWRGWGRTVKRMSLEAPLCHELLPRFR